MRKGRGLPQRRPRSEWSGVMKLMRKRGKRGGALHRQDGLVSNSLEYASSLRSHRVRKVCLPQLHSMYCTLQALQEMSSESFFRVPLWSG